MLKSKSFAKIILSGIILVHSLILSRIIFFPYPEIFVYPYLVNQGLKPYQQIFDQHFPGLLFLPINFNNLGMTTPEIARIWLIIIEIVIQLLIFFVGRKIFKSEYKALIANIFFLIWQPFLEGWVFWIDTFLPLFYIPAFYFTYQLIKQDNQKVSRQDIRNIVLVGIFLSFGVLFKQLTLPLTGLVIILIWFYRRDTKLVWYFMGGFLPVIILTTAYYWSMGVLKDLWYWTIIFNVTTFAKYGRKYPTFSELIRVLVIYSPISVLPFMRERKLAIVLAVFILGSISGDYARFDFVHFQTSLPFIVLLTAEVGCILWERRYLKFVIIGYLVIMTSWILVFYKGYLNNYVFFYDKGTLAIRDKIEQYTKPGEEIYLFGQVPSLYQLSNTIPAGRIFVFQFPWFVMETQDKFLQALQTSKPELVVYDKTLVIEGQLIIKFASKINLYIVENYHVVDKINNTEFMLRNK